MKNEKYSSLFKKMFLGLFVVLPTFLLAAGEGIGYADAVKGFGDAGGAAASGMGLGLIHFFNAGAMVLGILVAMVIIGYYFQKVDQEKRGVGKNIAAVLGAMFAGVLVLVAILSVESLIYDGEENCGPKLFSTYIKDASKSGFDPNYKFGSGIVSHGCLN